MNTTELFVRETSTSILRLICTIKPGVRFNTMPWWNKSDTKSDDLDHQLRAAKEQRNGWKFNGPWPNAEFEIHQNGEKVA